MTLKSDESACFKIDMRNLANFHQSRWEPFVQSRKFMSLKFTEESCVMTMNNDMTRNLMNFDSSTQKSKTFAV